MKVYTYNDKVLTNAANGKWLKKAIDKYNPLGLAPYTMRLRLTPGSNFNGAGTAVKIDDDNNIWDWTFGTGTNAIAMKSGSNIVEVLGINTHDITDFTATFNSCTNLSALPTNVYFGDGTKFFQFCEGCSSITTIPNYDLHSATDVDQAFKGCTNVESGALALYNQMSTQTNPPYKHTKTFLNCGSNTTTGAAELAQIPSSWGGTGA